MQCISIRSCPFDIVRVHDGIDNTSAVIGTYCGQQRNLVLYSSESNLFINFFTLQRTANTQNRGFKGIFEFSESFVKLDFIREFVALSFNWELYRRWVHVFLLQARTMECIYAALNAIRKYYPRRSRRVMFIHQIIHFLTFRKSFAGEKRRQCLHNFASIQLFFQLCFRFRYFIYGMQDAQNLERVKLDFSIFDIPKGEHKPKSE